MSTRATMTCQVKNGQLVLTGAIDERARLTELLDTVEGNHIVLDLAGITFINSIGVREWIRMQAVAMASEITIELRRVVIPIVHQLNIVIATRGTSLVTSFYAPYFCDHCDRETPTLLDVAVHRKELAHLKAPTIKCPECAKDMEFTEAPEIFFSFLGTLSTLTTRRTGGPE
jgi:hypothetical protein